MNTPPTHLSGFGSCPLHRRTPFGMRNVSKTQLSLARHYGGIKYNGDQYTYLPDTDELIRCDVQKWKRKQERALKKDEPTKNEQPELLPSA